jgi:membrane AbrB-like protein
MAGSKPDGRADIARGAWWRVAAALALCTLGGGLFAYLGVPLPWLLGALVLTTGSSIAGFAYAIPTGLRQSMIGVVGVMLGSTFTPERLSADAGWLPSLVSLPVYILLVGAVIYAYLRWRSDLDRTSVFFAAAPGGLSEMIALSDQMGGDVRSVSLVHATHLTFIVFTIPLLAALAGLEAPAAAPAAAPVPLAVWDVLILLVLALAGYALAVRVRLPAAAFLGPLFGSTLAHVTGWVEAAPPYALLAIAQLVIGSTVGERFAGVPLVVVRRAMLLGAGATLLMLAVTLAFAALLSGVTGHALLLLLLAFIPGGFTEMSLIALAMGVDPAFVVTHHSFRVFLVILIALPVFLLLQRAGWLKGKTKER